MQKEITTNAKILKESTLMLSDESYKSPCMCIVPMYVSINARFDLIMNGCVFAVPLNT